MYKWLLLLTGTTLAALLFLGRAEAQTGQPHWGTMPGSTHWAPSGGPAHWSTSPGVRQYLQYSGSTRGNASDSVTLPRPGFGFVQRQGVVGQNRQSSGYYYENQSDSYPWTVPDYSYDNWPYYRYRGTTRYNYFNNSSNAPGYFGYANGLNWPNVW